MYLCPLTYHFFKQKIMTKNIRLFVALVLAVFVCSSFTMKKGKEKPVYAFGVAASFSDTVVYYTPVQVLDSVALDKNGFLPQRDLYSYQLKNYLEYKLDKPNYTCVIYFSDNRKKLEKEAVKVKAGYEKSRQTLLSIEPDDFRFEKPKE